MDDRGQTLRDVNGNWVEPITLSFPINVKNYDEDWREEENAIRDRFREMAEEFIQQEFYLK